MTNKAAATAPAQLPGRELCQCGCGGAPKGKKSRFIPGHDAKLAAAEKKAAAAAAARLPELRVVKGGKASAPAKSPRKRGGVTGALVSGGRA